MYFAMSLILFVSGPVVAGLFPYILRNTGAAEFFLSLTRPGPQRGFHPILAEPLSAERAPIGRAQYFVPGALLSLTTIAGYLWGRVLPGGDLETCLILRNYFLGGLGAGGALLGLGIFIRQAWTEHRSAKLIGKMGIAGVWSGSDEEEVPFRRALLHEVERTRSLDAIGTDGLNILKLLSDPRQAPWAAPHPALRGARVRLLLLPPRSYRVDPERRRLTCAEEALSRLKRSPEDHWRQLHHSLEIRNHWAEEFQVSISVRFLEERPVFATAMVGSRVWFRPWDADRGLWIEGREEKRVQRLVSAVRDHFVAVWSSASQEISFPLTPGPSGSTFVRKGVDCELVEEADLA